jgi:hypothetical protein
MQSTGGVADRFAPLAARLERRLPGGPAFERGDISLQQLLAAAPGAPVELPLARARSAA